MHAFFYKNWKWVVGIIISLMTLAIPMWDLLANDKTKSINVSIDSITPIVGSHMDKVGKISISLDGNEVEVPYLSVVEISNTGGLPIEKNDFEKPLLITTGQKAQIIKATVTKTIPKNITSKVTWVGNDLFFHPALINPEDRIILSILSSVEKPSFEASARISGIKQVCINRNGNQKDNNFEGIVFLVIAFAYLISGYIVFNPLKKGASFNRFGMWFIGLLLLLVFAIAIENFFKAVGIIELWKKILIMFGAMAIAIVISEYINKRAQQIN